MTKMEDFKDTLKRTIKQNSFAVCSIPTEDCKEILQALEKQIPCKPIKETEDLIGRPIEHIAYSCPRCKVSVNDVIESPYTYCMKCGQAIDKSNLDH